SLLVIAVASFGYWLLENQKAGAWTGILSLLFFTYLRCVSFYQSDHQQKLIIYNVPKHQAIDIINGRNYFFMGDGDLMANDFVRNFHIKPSRVLHRAEAIDHFQQFFRQENFLQWNQKRILLIDKKLIFDSCAVKIP